MKISDLLRTVADQIDDEDQVPLAMTDGSADESESEASTAKIMVPPLQQHLELLKKESGLDNVFDKEADTDTETDELDQLKKMAGLSQTPSLAMSIRTENK